jgi:hypothetical protein
MATRRLVYRVFQEPGGYYFCDDARDYLDARGSRYPSKAEATEAAIRIGRQVQEHENVEFVGVTGSGVDRETAEAMDCDVID